MSQIPPSRPESIPIPSPSNDDQEGDDMMIDLINIATGGQYSPALKQFVDSVFYQVPHPPTHLAIENAVSSIIAGTGTPLLDVYIAIAQQNITPPLTQGDLDTVLNQLQATAQKYGDQWSLTAPAPTGIDVAFQQVYPLLEGFTSGVQVLASVFMAMITQKWGSGGNVEETMNWLDNVLLSLKSLSAFSGLDANQLTSFIQAAYPPGASHGAPSADFLAQYSPTVVYLQTLTPGTDDFNFFNKMFSLYVEGWATSSLDPVGSFTENEYQTEMFSDYPNLTEAAAVKMESIFSLAVPPVQHQLFETRSWIAGPPPLSGQDLLLAQGYLMAQGIKSLWPMGGGPSDLVNWFNVWTASLLDMYMDLPLASDAAYSKLTQIVGVPLFPPTPNDRVMMQFAKNQEAFNEGTNDYALYEAGLSACQGGGSHDDKLTAVTNWINPQISTIPPFNQYLPLQPHTIISLLNAIDYKCVIQYFQSYLTFWMGIHIPQYEKDLAEKFKQIINGYTVTHPHPNAAEFQQYIDEYMANPQLDLCLAIPGITPWHVNQLFSDLGISVPYTPPIPAYPNADYAYAGVCQILASVTNPKKEPDFDIFTQLVHQIRDSIVNGSADGYKNNVLAWVQNIVNNPSVFEELNTDSQDVLNAILKMG